MEDPRPLSSSSDSPWANPSCVWAARTVEGADAAAAASDADVMVVDVVSVPGDVGG